MLGVSQSRGLKLFGREIIFEEFQPMCCWYLNVTDRRTDGQTDGRLTVALPRSALASRGKQVCEQVNRNSILQLSTTLLHRLYPLKRPTPKLRNFIYLLYRPLLITWPFCTLMCIIAKIADETVYFYYCDDWCTIGYYSATAARLVNCVKHTLWQELHSVHSHFHQQLRKAVSKEGSHTVGECFLTCKEKFLVHGNYCSNLLAAQTLIDKLSANSSNFNNRLMASSLSVTGE